MRAIRIRELVLTFFFPGLGHLVAGRTTFGAVVLALNLLAWLCFWPLRLVAKAPVLALAFLFFAATWSVGLCHLSFVWARERSKPKWVALLVGLVAATIAWAVALNLGMIIGGFRPFTLPSESMEPTIKKDEAFVADMRAFHRRLPERGEIVIVKMPPPSNMLTKRVVAIPGDEIQSTDDRVFVNGKELVEPFVQHVLPEGTPEMHTFGPLKLPPGKYFLMGDNRDLSFDSRLEQFGLVDASRFIGKPLYIYRSPDPSRGMKELK
jgi:signal peptidase I